MLKHGHEVLFGEISRLSYKKKDFICDCVIILAKLDFKVQFMNWYSRNKVDKDTFEGEDK